MPAAIGVKTAKPDQHVVAVVGDYSFQFLMEEVAVAAQYGVPFVIVMLNNGYLGLIRQAEIPYSMNFGVDISFDDIGVDHVQLMQSFGCPARRITEPGLIAETLQWAEAESERLKRPALVELMIEREANAAMGTAIDAIVEYEPVPELASASRDVSDRAIIKCRGPVELTGGEPTSLPGPLQAFEPRGAYK